MKATTEEQNARTLQNLESRITEELTPIDREARFDNMLDECYSFETVGGIFANMSPSRVLRECDPVAHRCGVNDFADSEDWTEVDGEYYESREVEKVRDDFVAELEVEAEEMQAEVDEIESDESIEPGSPVSELATLATNLEAKREEIAFLEKYTF